MLIPLYLLIARLGLSIEIVFAIEPIWPDFLENNLISQRFAGDLIFLFN